MKTAAVAVDSPDQFIPLSSMVWDETTGNYSQETLIRAVKGRIKGKPVGAGALLCNLLQLWKAELLGCSPTASSLLM